MTFDRMSDPWHPVVISAGHACLQITCGLQGVGQGRGTLVEAMR